MNRLQSLLLLHECNVCEAKGVGCFKVLRVHTRACSVPQLDQLVPRLRCGGELQMILLTLLKVRLRQGSRESGRVLGSVVVTEV